MHLQSKIWVNQDIEQVTKFFYDLTTLPKWDRSVAAVIPTSQTPGESVRYIRNYCAFRNENELQGY